MDEKKLQGSTEEMTDQTMKRNSNSHYESGRSYRSEERMSNAAYEYESTVRETETSPRRQRREYEQPSRKNSKRAARKLLFVNPIGTIIIIGVFAIFGYTMVSYVNAQSELTSKVKSVANKQVELTELKSENDEHYSRIIGSVDLNDIEATARGELGMTYATEGQIVTYTPTSNDYMRKTDSNNQ